MGDDALFEIDVKTAKVPITVDVNTITSNTDIYSETDTDGSIGAQIVFCVRFGLNTLGDSPVEVNFLESVVTLNVDLSAGFSIDDINVTPKDQLINTAAQAYTGEGYMCNPGTDTPVDDAAAALNQGSLITVCIKPDADAISDGIKMRTVDSFEWTRDATTQTAVESGIAAGNLLTSFDETACEGGDYCQFSSILFAAFYATEGQVSGAGVASMQFGTGRRLSSNDGEANGGLRSRAHQQESYLLPSLLLLVPSRCYKNTQKKPNLHAHAHARTHTTNFGWRLVNVL